MFKTILFAFLIASGTAAMGQSLSIDKDQAALETIFVEIHEKTGYFFYYSEKDLSHTHRVTIHGSQLSLKAVLDRCFEGQPIGYQIENKTIVVKRKTVVESIAFPLRGLVQDEQGNAMESVTVTLATSGKSFLTNSDGLFFIENIARGVILTFTSVGFETATAAAEKDVFIKINLKKSVSKLDEIQVIAYGSTTQRLTTGNVSKLSSRELADQPVDNPMNALSGRLPGVYIQQSSGVPGSDVSIQIRGRNSLRTDGNNPLYIIDGVQFSSSTPDDPSSNFGGTSSSAFNNLNPGDIESIEVLKDADATAIYGSRGANGVVLITTKSGKPGKTAVDIGVSTGWQKISRQMPLLKNPDYLTMRHEAFRNDAAEPDISNAPDLLLWDSTRYTDWQQKLIGGTARRTTANAGISGGNKLIQYLVSGQYSHQTTVYPGKFSDKKGSFHVSLSSASENGKLLSRVQLSFISDTRYLPQSSMMTEVQMAPDGPGLYDSSGQLNWASGTWQNPAATLQQTNQGNNDNLIADFNLAYHLLSGLDLKANVGYNQLNGTQQALTPLSSFNPAYGLTSGYAIFSKTSNSTWVSEPMIDFTHRFGKAVLTAQIGATFQQSRMDLQSLLGLNFSGDIQLRNIQSAGSVIVLRSGKTDYRYFGGFSRIGLSWDDRYLLNITGRRDGSSRFGPGKQFGDFGAIGAGWIFSKEGWFKKQLHFISFGKLRASYGTAGNDQIADYGYFDTYQPTGLSYRGISVLTPQSLSNPDYSWESITKAEIGLQTGFMKDRLLFSASYYRNRSSNQLVGYPLPAITGFTVVIANLPAKVENTGWELEATSANIKSALVNWTSTVTLTVPSNKLLSYPNLAGSPYANRYVIGHSLYSNKTLAYEQIDPQTGAYTFRDYDKDGNISYPNDAQYVQRTGYRFYGGVNNSLNCKGFQLDIFFQFVNGNNANYISNFPAPGSFYTGISYNQPDYVLKRWKKPGDNGDVQRFTQDFSSAAGQAYANLQSSNRLYVNASFIRLQNMAISYSLPTALIRRLPAKSARVYLQAQNLFVWTSYTGYDPEVGSSLPPLKTIVAGIQISL